MTRKTNKYFTEMLKKATEFESARAARRVEKEALIREGDWDGMKEWNEREQSFKFPFTHGQRCAFRAWDKSNEGTAASSRLKNFLGNRSRRHTNSLNA